MRTKEQHALVLAMCVLVFAPLALGSAPRWASCISSGLALVTLVPFVTSRAQQSVTPVVGVLGVMLLATTIQLVPLPPSVVEVLSPQRLAVAQANAKALGQEVSWLPLSHDWPATLVELVKLCGYMAFATTCGRLCVSRTARVRIVQTVVAVGAFLAFSALAHRLAGAQSLLGIYKPTTPSPGSLTPFVNPNHLAGFLSFVAPLCVVLAWQKRSMLFSLLGLLIVAGVVQAASRAGTVALLVGLSVTGVLLGIRSANDVEPIRHRRRRLTAVIAAMVLAILVALWGTTAGNELLSSNLAKEQESGKLLAWSSAPQLIMDSPWVGVGRGAFEHAFTRVQPPLYVTFSHIENEYLQVVLDWGIPTAILVLFLSWLALSHATRNWQHGDLLALGGLGSLSALVVHNFADFALELPGMALTAIAILALLVPPTLAASKKRTGHWRPLGRSLFIGAGLFLCALGLSPPGASAAEDARDMREAVNMTPHNEVYSFDQLERHASRHPSDYYGFALAAEGLWQRDDARAFTLLQRALALRPHHSGLHLLAARMLYRSQNPRQALGAYRDALRAPGLRKVVFEEVIARFPAISDIASAIPDTSTTPQYLKYLGILFEMSRTDAVETVSSRLLRDQPHHFALGRLYVLAALRNEKLPEATRHAEALDSHHQSEESLALLAQVLGQSGRIGDAAQLLGARLSTGPSSHHTADKSHQDLYATLASLQIKLGELQLAKETLTHLLSIGDTAHRATAHRQLAYIEEQNGNHNQANWHRQRANAPEY